MVSKELLNELKEILKDEFSLKLTNEQVVEIANSLIGYFEVLIKINNNQGSVNYD